MKDKEQKERGLITAEQARELINLPLDKGEPPAARMAKVMSLFYEEEDCSDCECPCHRS